LQRSCREVRSTRRYLMPKINESGDKTETKERIKSWRREVGGQATRRDIQGPHVRLGQTPYRGDRPPPSADSSLLDQWPLHFVNSPRLVPRLTASQSPCFLHPRRSGVVMPHTLFLHRCESWAHRARFARGPSLSTRPTLPTSTQARNHASKDTGS